MHARDPRALTALESTQELLRSVTTPEFEGATFHEVTAKSALNFVRVPSKYLPSRWTINPYRGCSHACGYCYARPTHQYLGMNASEDFEQQLVVKMNIAHVLEAELSRMRTLPDHVAIGTSTDPYQRAEGRYRLMPGIIDVLSNAGIPFSFLTKGTVVRRDLELLADAQKQTHITSGVSLSLLDEGLQASLEPGTPSPAARLRTIRMLREAGLPCTVFIAPVLPHIADSEEQLDELAAAIADAGANEVVVTPLYLSKGVRELYASWLRSARPDLVPRYRALFGSNTWLPRGYQDAMLRRANNALRKNGLSVIDGEGAVATRSSSAGRPPANDLTLFDV